MLVTISGKKGKNISQRVVEYILTRQDGELADLDGEGIARMLAVKKGYISRKFESELKISLEKFILRERIYRAFFLIESNREMTGKEISERLGFPEFKDFSKEFANLFLVEPDRYIHLKRNGSRFFENRRHSYAV